MYTCRLIEIIQEKVATNVSFLENKFSSIEEVDKDFQFYELEDPNGVITSIVDIGISANSLGIVTLSGSETPDTLIRIRESTRKSSRKSIPCRHFEIEGDVL